MPIKRINEFPEGSGSLSNDDVFLFMDDPSGSGITKKISLSDISDAIGGGGGSSNPFDQNLNTTDFPTFSGVSLSNGTTLAQGTFDNNTGGNGGISLNCAVGYELNWQGGRLRSSQIGDPLATPQSIYCDSPVMFSSGITVDGISEIRGITTELYSDGDFLSFRRVDNGNMILSTEEHSLFDMNSIWSVQFDFRSLVDVSGVSTLYWGVPNKIGINKQYPDYNLDVTGSGNFSSGLYVNDVPVSVSGHKHNPIVVQLGNVSGTINTNATLGEIFDMTIMSSGTIANPSGGVDGQTLRWRITHNANNIPVTLGNNFRIPNSATSPLPFSNASGLTDLLGATYDASRNKWDIIAFVPGY